MNTFSFLLALAVIALNSFTQSYVCAQSSPTTDLDQSESKEIEQFFDTLSDSLWDSDSLDEFFAVDEMMEAAIQTRKKLDVSSVNKRRLARRLRSRFCTRDGRWPMVYPWDDHDIRKIQIEDNLATVTSRQWYDEFEFHNKYQWKLVKNDDGNWQIYDVQDLDRGLKLSSLLGVGTRMIEDNPDWIKELGNVVKSVTSDGQEYLEDDRIAELQRPVDTLLGQNLPDDVLCYLYLLKLEHLMYEDEVEQALEVLNEMEALDEQYPGVLLFRGEALYMMDRSSEATTHLEEYASLYDNLWDAEICEILSDIHRDLQQIDQAIDYAKKGLEDRQSAWGCLASLAVALPADRKSEMDPYVEAEGNTEHLLEFLIDWSLELGDELAAFHAFKILKKQHPESDLIEFYADYFGR